MHIPDGYLSPQTFVPLYGASFVFLAIALKKIKKELIHGDQLFFSISYF